MQASLTEAEATLCTNNASDFQCCKEQVRILSAVFGLRQSNRVYAFSEDPESNKFVPRKNCEAGPAAMALFQLSLLLTVEPLALFPL